MVIGQSQLAWITPRSFDTWGSLRSARARPVDSNRSGRCSAPAPNLAMVGSREVSPDIPKASTKCAWLWGSLIDFKPLSMGVPERGSCNSPRPKAMVAARMGWRNR